MALFAKRTSPVDERLLLARATVNSAEALRARACTGPMTRPGELAAARRAVGFQNVRETAFTIRME